MTTAETAAQIKKQAQGRGISGPFLFSLYPVLQLYLYNIREVGLTQAFWAASASLIIAFFSWLLIGIFSRRRDKRSLLLFVFLLLFHFYGLYYEQIAGLLPQAFRPIQAHLLALILPGTVWIAMTILIARSQRSFLNLNRFLRVTVLFLLAWNVAGIVIHHGRFYFDQPRQKRPEFQPLPASQNRAPDIYCFVLDEFAAPEATFNLFGYDNSAFVASLRRQGFFVAEQSRSLFALTEPAIAAILNLGEVSAGQDPFTQVRRSTVVAMLKNYGYRIIDFACQPSLFLEKADQRIFFPLARVSIFFDDFYRSLFERSLLRVLPDLWQLEKTDLSRFYRQRILQVFKTLPAVVKTPGPKFIFVHLFSPHEPFVFDAEGKLDDPSHIWERANPRYYLQQYIYISRRILETTAMILKHSPTAPVIIIQSDHGYRGTRRPQKGAKPLSQAEMTQVLNALYLPGISQATIASCFSPLNNFRLVFNLYFGASYPFLQNP